MFGKILRKVVPKPSGYKKPNGEDYLKKREESVSVDTGIEEEIILDDEFQQEETIEADERYGVDYNQNVSNFAKIVLNAVAEVVGEEPIITGVSKSLGFVGIRPLTGSYSKKKRDIAESVKMALLREDVEVFKVDFKDNLDRCYLGCYIIDIDLVEKEQ